MKGTEWKFIFESVAGRSHIKLGLSCQDSSKCDVIVAKNKDPILVAIVSDGAGSAKYADIGSNLACSFMYQKIKGFFEDGNSISDVSSEVIMDLINTYKNNLEKDNACLRNFACTILIALVAPLGAVFFQVGDGAIVISERKEPDKYSWVFWPSNGEYENTTYFITDDLVHENLKTKFIEGDINNVALFTDGLQRLVLDYKNKSVHTQFFTPIFEYLNTVNKISSRDLKYSLRKFLNSDRVNERTDDDKTLILAVRKYIGKAGGD